LAGWQLNYDTTDLLGVGVMHVHQLLDALGVVRACPPVRHLDVTPPAQRFAHHEEVARPLALVLVVRPGVPALAGSPRPAYLAEELPAGLVEAHLRALRVVGQHVGLDHVLHVPDELAVGIGRHAPGLDDPRLDVVF
jgi:hypothetical protein